MEARAVHGNYCHDETEHVVMAVGQVGLLYRSFGGLIPVISSTPKYVCGHVTFCLCTGSPFKQLIFNWPSGGSSFGVLYPRLKLKKNIKSITWVTR